MSKPLPQKSWPMQILGGVLMIFNQ